MILILGRNEFVSKWLARRFGAHVVQTPAECLGVFNRGEIVGAFVVTWRNDTTAELHVYGEVSNETVRDMFGHVFGRWGVYRLEVRTSRTNKTVKKAAPKFGFKFEGVARHYYGPGDDALLFSMTPDQCRWISDGVALQVA